MLYDRNSALLRDYREGQRFGNTSGNTQPKRPPAWLSTDSHPDAQQAAGGTDKEWEFVCRANSTSGYGFGEPLELLTRYAWYNDNSKLRMWPVGTKLPNGLGVFDMHGNAWEWCHNLYGAPKGQPDLVAKNNGRRLLRGGAFTNQPSDVRSAVRSLYIHPDVRINSVYGFRARRVKNLSRTQSAAFHTIYGAPDSSISAG